KPRQRGQDGLRQRASSKKRLALRAPTTGELVGNAQALRTRLSIADLHPSQALQLLPDGFPERCHALSCSGKKRRVGLAALARSKRLHFEHRGGLGSSL